MLGVTVSVSGSQGPKSWSQRLTFSSQSLSHLSVSGQKKNLTSETFLLLLQIERFCLDLDLSDRICVKMGPEGDHALRMGKGWGMFARANGG